MAHFAQLDENSVVTQVIVLSNAVVGESYPESESVGVSFIAEQLRLTGVWVQTSYNGNFRGTYAGIGYTYDEDLDAFIPPKPYESWSLDENTYQWEAPIPYPAEGIHTWDEQAGVWVEVEDEAG